MEAQQYTNIYAQLIGNVIMHMSLKQYEKLHGEKLT